MTIHITEHAVERGKERLGWGASVTESMAARAWETGIRYRDVAGRLRKYIAETVKDYPGTRVRIHGEVLYLFRGGALVTLYQLPRSLVKNAIIIQDKLRKRDV